MAQAFITTNLDTYRWPPYQDRAEIHVSLVEKYYTSVPAGENEWKVVDANPVKPFEHISNEELRKFIKKLVLSRYRTSYQDHYRDPRDAQEQVMDLLSKHELQLYKDAEHLNTYTGKTLKVPPQATFRKIFGYCRPRRFGPKLTSYQVHHGTIAFRSLRGDYIERDVEVVEVPDSKPTKKKAKLKKKHEKTDACECKEDLKIKKLVHRQ
ncbi:uncharacterized protein LOC109598393 [Aethina tumida]|uniref:uncharacterized protein LOC109598393 n=1 Tax=Aethina tumida TaxID=116153 RepID=UPI0021496D91|nr:uncharacterized protein LOC109598393 [Aethina tumida]